MPIPSTMADLSTTASLNSPAGSDNIASGDDYIRSIQAILKAQVSTGGAITAASTITPDASGQYYVVSGATGISAIGSANSWNGRIVVLEFASTPVITHNGTSLILPGAANITAAAGDVAGFVQESSGNWRCIFYQRGASLTNGSAASGANSDITSLSALTSINGGPLAGLRNRIINGGCLIAQRSAPTISATAAYGQVDRHMLYISSGSAFTGTFSQITGVSTSNGYACGVSGGSWTNGNFILQHRIESLNTIDLNSKTITISAKVFQNTGGTRNWKIQLAKPTTTADTFSAQTVLQTSAAIPSTTGVWTTVSATFTLGASDASLGLAVFIYDSDAVNTVSAKSYYVGDIDLREGTVAPTYPENRPVGLELALCQRYLPVGIIGINDPVPARVAATNTNFTGTFSFKVPARTAPTGCTPNSVTDFTVNATTGGGQTSNVTFSTGGINGATVVFAAAAGTSGNGCEVVGRSASSLLYFTGCEL